MKKSAIIGPILWSCLAFILSAVIASYVVTCETVFLEENPEIAEQLENINVSAGFPIFYFFGAVVVIGVILLLIPVSKLKWLFGVLFMFLYAWGMFVVLVLALPSWIPALIIAVTGGIAWFFIPKIWLHNLLMLVALAGIAAVFGILLDPWPVMGFLLVVAIYDFLAVRFGYMMWMAKKLSQSSALPALVVPRIKSNWNRNLKSKELENLIDGEIAEREYSILGGGDIGFPLILMVAVRDTYGLVDSVIIAAFSLVGLVSAYIIQRVFLKGKPMPAMPPISLFSLIGLLIVHFLLN
jgi:presenilin-like A22 family membrane protease